MAEDKKNPNMLTDSEEMVYETRFLLNVLISQLVRKNVFTEAEFSKTYNDILKEVDRK